MTGIRCRLITEKFPKLMQTDRMSATHKQSIKFKDQN